MQHSRVSVIILTVSLAPAMARAGISITLALYCYHLSHWHHSRSLLLSSITIIMIVYYCRYHTLFIPLALYHYCLVLLLSHTLSLAPARGTYRQYHHSRSLISSSIPIVITLTPSRTSNDTRRAPRTVVGKGSVGHAFKTLKRKALDVFQHALVLA